MLVIGIAGGVASGKSLVAERFRQLGAEILDADRFGHEVLREPEVAGAVLERWGRQVLGEDGHVDRAAVARIVFAPPPRGPQELAFLESLTHPRIGTRLRMRISQLRQEGLPAAVLDAAVMFKAGWSEFCDKIVFIDVPDRLRRQRAKFRGWSDAEFAARESAQEALDVKRHRADVVIDNSGSPQQTFSQVNRIWHSWISGRGIN